MPVKVAMVVSTKGYHWEEVFGAYEEFRRAGWEVGLYTVNGDKPKPDPSSLKRTGPLSIFGYGVSKRNSPDNPFGQELMHRFTSVKALSELNTDKIEALYLPGGFGCMFDMNRNEQLHDLIMDLKKKEKVLSGVCHATSTFAFVNEGAGSIVRGKKITGFPKSLDLAAIGLGIVDPEFLPLPFSNEDTIKKEGADLKWYNRLIAALNPLYVRTDWPFVTGVGPKAARRVAKKIVRKVNRINL